MEFLFDLLVASAAAAVVDDDGGGFPATVLTFERDFSATALTFERNFPATVPLNLGFFSLSMEPFLDLFFCFFELIAFHRSGCISSELSAFLSSRLCL